MRRADKKPPRHACTAGTRQNRPAGQADRAAEETHGQNGETTFRAGKGEAGQYKASWGRGHYRRTIND